MTKDEALKKVQSKDSLGGSAAVLYCFVFRLLILILGKPSSSLSISLSLSLSLSLFGQAKRAIYISRKKMLKGIVGQKVEMVFKNLVKSRVLIDFKFYKLVNDYEGFLQRWGYNETVCTVVEGMVVFALVLE